MMRYQQPPKIDVRQAALMRLGIEGCDVLLHYERLRSESQGNAGQQTLHWAVQLEQRLTAGAYMACWLNLRISTVLLQTCQRCLGSVPVSVQVERAFRFVASEEQAEQQDADCEEDLLVISREFDLAALIEDEVLLALPLVALHGSCPGQVRLQALDADFVARPDQPHAFAVLAQLKTQPDGKA